MGGRTANGPNSPIRSLAATRPAPGALRRWRPGSPRLGPGPCRPAQAPAPRPGPAARRGAPAAGRVRRPGLHGPDAAAAGPGPAAWLEPAPLARRPRLAPRIGSPGRRTPGLGRGVWAGDHGGTGLRPPRQRSGGPVLALRAPRSPGPGTGLHPCGDRPHRQRPGRNPAAAPGPRQPSPGPGQPAAAPADQPRVADQPGAPPAGPGPGRHRPILRRLEPADLA